MKTIVLVLLLMSLASSGSAQDSRPPVCFEFHVRAQAESEMVERIQRRMILQARQLGLLCPRVDYLGDTAAFDSSETIAFFHAAETSGNRIIKWANVYLEAWEHSDDLFDLVAILTEDVHALPPGKERRKISNLFTKPRTIHWGRNYRPAIVADFATQALDKLLEWYDRDINR